MNIPELEDGFDDDVFNLVQAVIDGHMLTADQVIGFSSGVSAKTKSVYSLPAHWTQSIEKGDPPGKRETLGLPTREHFLDFAYDPPIGKRFDGVVYEGKECRHGGFWEQKDQGKYELTWKCRTGSCGAVFKPLL